MNNSHNEKDIFSNDALSARDQVSSWANIKQNIGDKVHGEFLGWWEQPANPGFRPQLGMALKQGDGSVIGVTVTDTSYMRSQIEETEVGDGVGLKYVGDKEVGKPQPAKIIKYFNPDLQNRKKEGVVSNGSTPATVGGTKSLDDEFPTDNSGDEQPVANPVEESPVQGTIDESEYDLPF